MPPSQTATPIERLKTGGFGTSTSTKMDTLKIYKGLNFLHKETMMVYHSLDAGPKEVLRQHGDKGLALMTKWSSKPVVLAVDDEPAVLEVYTEAIEMDLGCKVQTAVNWATALACLAHEDIELVILDLSLPDMKVLNALRRIKEMDKNLKVVITTSNPDPMLKSQAMQAGANAYFLKPFTMDKLLNTIAIALNRRRLFLSRELYSQHQAKIIVRSIEFPAEYYQAGIGILSYFYSVIQQKCPNIPVKINIEQEDLAVRMIIETPEGHRDIVERTLADYGTVIAGKKAPENLLQNELDIIALKHKLEMTALELRHTRDLLKLSKSGRKSLEAQVDDLRQLVGSSLQHFQGLNIHFLENLTQKTSKYHIETVIGWNSGDVSDTAHVDIIPTVTYNSNDLVEIGKLVDELLNRYREIHIPTDQLAAFEEALQTMQAQLAVQTPNQSIIKEALRSVRNIIEEAMGGAIGNTIGNPTTIEWLLALQKWLG